MRSISDCLGGGSRSSPCKLWKCADIGDDWPSMSSTTPGLHTDIAPCNISMLLYVTEPCLSVFSFPAWSVLPNHMVTHTCKAHTLALVCHSGDGSVE